MMTYFYVSTVWLFRDARLDVNVTVHMSY